MCTDLDAKKWNVNLIPYCGSNIQYIYISSASICCSKRTIFHFPCGTFCCDPVSSSTILAATPRKTKFIDKSLTMLLHLFFFLLLSLPPPHATAASSAFPLSIYRLASNSPFPLYIVVIGVALFIFLLPMLICFHRRYSMYHTWSKINIYVFNFVMQPGNLA